MVGLVFQVDTPFVEEIKDMLLANCGYGTKNAD